MCTGIRFTDASGAMYAGRNLDWSSPFGEVAIATPRNYSNPRCDAIGLDCRYASMGMGVIAEGFPLYFDAGNEKGLSCAGLNFPGYASYVHHHVDGRCNIPSYAFPLFVVSQFASVDEVEEALQGVAISDEPFNERFGASMLHWMVCDKSRSIVVEHTASGMHVFSNELDVLANQPEFPFHRENVRNYISLTPEFPQPVEWREQRMSAYGSGSGMRGLPGDFYSPSRFVRAAYLNAHHPEQLGEHDNVLRAFKTLQGVAMVLGGAKMESGDFEYTTYTSVFSASTMTYYYSTYDDPGIRSFPMTKDACEGEGVVRLSEDEGKSLTHG